MDGNSTTYPSPGYFRVSLPLAAFYIAAFTLLFIVGLVGNIFVIFSVIGNATMRTTTNGLLVGLAVADLLILCITLPTTLINNTLTSWLHRWPFGDLMCRCTMWLSYVTSTASVYTLLLVTVDRYLAIVHTLRYARMQPSCVPYALLPVWCICALLFTPMFWLAKHYIMLINPHNNNYTVLTSDADVPDALRPYVVHFCFTQYPSPMFAKMFFTGMNFGVAYLIPLLVITVIYTNIFVKLQERARAQAQLTNQKTVKNVFRTQRIRTRVTWMTFSVIIVFVVTWTPLYLLYMLYFYVPMEPKVMAFISEVARPLVQWLSVANSSIDPIVYVLFSRSLKEQYAWMQRASQSRICAASRRVTKRVRSTMGKIRRSSSATPSVSIASHLQQHGGGHKESSGTIGRLMQSAFNGSMQTVPASLLYDLQVFADDPSTMSSGAVHPDESASTTPMNYMDISRGLQQLLAASPSYRASSSARNSASVSGQPECYSETPPPAPLGSQRALSASHLHQQTDRHRQQSDIVNVKQLSSKTSCPAVPHRRKGSAAIGSVGSGSSLTVIQTVSNGLRYARRRQQQQQPVVLSIVNGAATHRYTDRPPCAAPKA